MAKKIEYTVAQGVQLFLIDTILQRRFPPRFRDFIGSGKDVEFFGEWSGIVREHFSDDLSKASFKLPENYREVFSKKLGTAEFITPDDQGARRQELNIDLTAQGNIPVEFHEFLNNPAYTEYFQLMEDEDLGRLMVIEYPEETGLIKAAKEQVEAEIQDDEKVIDEAIRKVIKLETGAITDELYASIPGLDLSDKKLKGLPTKIIEKLTGLKRLDLEGNQLTSVPESLGNLGSLKGLNLGGNQLTTVAEAIGELTGLQRLDLQNNLLTTLPEAIGELTALAALDLYGNQFSEEEKGRIRGLVPEGCEVVF